ncbi:LysR family transcriptional regulator [Phytopseudomonas dryadis]|uniref:LysR family transcriptional regulator n=1 Tax=Phytopseudomonas dryadis TaxID=2487520 RepID=A0A4Q9QUK0_9GAMM|nr:MULTISPECIES: LysR family transcriptional regulator [Pseudomonas]TBU87159.1 LysR family transcriptional regulator [Pseudomonas dryadis]TBV01817.1 LysR family transcriptional regulator [Pseudomonas dryadis]TBV14437.1 LysR family transcriptional regulator [Pseudomonas sp. FRB 230]
MRQPNLSDVALFAAVVEAGGFRAAAQKRGMSASSLSDCLRRLESDVGLRLLNRTTRSVTPTAAGERLLERLRPALEAIEAAFNDLDDEAQRPVGTLKLNVPVPVARYLLPDLLSRFLRLYPGVNVEVVMENTFIDVIAAGYDAGVRYEESLAKDMIAVPIGPRRQRFVAAASPAYLAAHGTPRHPSELTDHQLLGHRFESGKVSIFEFEKDGRTLRIPPRGQLLTSSQDLKTSAAINGLGIVYTFEDFIREPLADGRLLPILEDWWQAFDGPYLYYHGRRHMPSPLRAFVDFVKAEARASAAP